MSELKSEEQKLCRLCGKNPRLEDRRICRQCRSKQQVAYQHAHAKTFTAYCPQCETYRHVRYAASYAGKICKKCWSRNAVVNKVIRDCKHASAVIRRHFGIKTQGHP